MRSLGAAAALAALLCTATTAAPAAAQEEDRAIVPALPATPLPETPEAEPPPPALPDEAQLPKPPKHPRLAVAELTLSLLGGMAWYWRDPSFNMSDWELRWDWPSWKKKAVTFEAVRFDDNAFDTNLFLHGFDGTGMYLIARGNRLAPLTSFLLVAGSSVAWEYLVEFREVVSVNDMIITPSVGFALGEPMIRVAQFLRAGPPDPVADTLAVFFDPIGAVNGWGEDLAGRRYDRSGPGRGSYRHRIDFGMGIGSADLGAGVQRIESELAAGAVLDLTPGSARPGRRAAWAGPGSLVALSGSGAVADGRLARLGLASRAALAGRVWRAYDESPDGDGRQGDGHDLYLGLGSGFEYAARERPAFSRDTLGIARLVGPLVVAGATRGGLRVELIASASYDFALVHALGIDALVAATGIEGLPAVVATRRYYYAQGLSLDSTLVARLRWFEAGAQIGEDAFWSIDGLDRFEQNVTRRVSAFDSRGRRRAWAAARPFEGLALMPAVSAEQLRRDGSIGGVAAAELETRVMGSVNVVF